MSKPKMNSRERRRQEAQRKKTRTFLLRLGLAVLFIGIVALAASEFFKQGHVECPGQIALQDYPPDLTFGLVTGEKEAWERGYQGNPADINYADKHLDWIIDQLSKSASPIARQSAQTYNNRKSEFERLWVSAMEQGVNAKVHLYNGKLGLDLIQGQFEPGGYPGVSLSIVLVHELLHIRMYTQKADELVHSRKLERKEAYELVAQESESPPENKLCGEIQAIAFQTAYLAQMEHIGIPAYNLSSDIVILRKLNWDMWTIEWRDYVLEGGYK